MAAVNLHNLLHEKLRKRIKSYFPDDFSIAFPPL